MPTDYDATETDWLANSSHAYGFGYTKEQALYSMLAHMDRIPDRPLQVDLVEHVGDATVSMSGWRVEEFVSGERVEIPEREWKSARDDAIEANAGVSDSLDKAEQVEDLSDLREDEDDDGDDE